jgi:hypothetical protein
MEHMPIKREEVDEALRNLHPNKTDWTPFERSNMERVLYRFWEQRIAALQADTEKPTSICPHCGPTCYGGAEHNAKAEDGFLYKTEAEKGKP